VTALLYWRPENPVVHRVSYGTDVLKTWSGLENRVAWLDAPRDTYELSYFFPTEAEVRRWRTRLFVDLDQQWQIPIWPEGLVVNQAITGTSVHVDTTNSDWAIATGPVFLENDNGDYYTANILSVASPGVGAVLTLDASPPGGTTWPANGCQIFALGTFILGDNPAFGRYPANAAVLRVVATRVDFRAVIGTGSTVATYDSLPVLAPQPTIPSGTAQEQFMSGAEVGDEGAKITSDVSWTFQDIRRELSFNIGRAADRQYLYKFLQTVLGRQGAFLLPTWGPDLLVSVQPTTTALRVTTSPVHTDAVNYVTDLFPSAAHRHLQLRMTDGSIIYRKVNSAVDNGDGTQTLTLDAAVDTSGANPDVSVISLLETCRLADDEVTFTYKNQVGSAMLPCLVVQR
jgi:hypothetical protein